MKTNEIKNFDDLAQDTEFTFKGNTYVIPAISNDKATKLFQLGKKVNKNKTEFTDADIEKSEETSDFIKEQADFICLAVLRKNGEALQEVPVEEIGAWPMKVSMAVVKLINECISGIKEDTPEEKKQ